MYISLLFLLWPRIQPDYFPAESGSGAQDDCLGNSTAIFPFPDIGQPKRWKKGTFWPREVFGLDSDFDSVQGTFHFAGLLCLVRRSLSREKDQVIKENSFSHPPWIFSSSSSQHMTRDVCFVAGIFLNCRDIQSLWRSEISAHLPSRAQPNISVGLWNWICQPPPNPSQHYTEI